MKLVLFKYIHYTIVIPDRDHKTKPEKYANGLTLP